MGKGRKAVQDFTEITNEKYRYTVIQKEIPSKGKGYILVKRVQSGDFPAVVEGAAKQLALAGAKTIYCTCSDQNLRLPEAGFEAGDFSFRYDSNMDVLEKELPPFRERRDPAGFCVSKLSRDNQEAFLRVYNDCFFEVPNSETYTQADIRRIAGDPVHFYAAVVEQDGEAVGICELSFESLIPEIASIGIIEAKRGRGLGYGTLTYALNYLAHAGYRRASLRVSTQNPKAYALYLRNGFEKTKTLSRFYVSHVRT